MPHSSFKVNDLENTNYPKFHVSITPVGSTGTVKGRNDGTNIQYRENYPSFYTVLLFSEDTNSDIQSGTGTGGGISIYAKVVS